MRRRWQEKEQQIEYIYWCWEWIESAGGGKKCKSGREMCFQSEWRQISGCHLSPKNGDGNQSVPPPPSPALLPRPPPPVFAASAAASTAASAAESNLTLNPLRDSLRLIQIPLHFSPIFFFFIIIYLFIYPSSFSAFPDDNINHDFNNNQVESDCETVGDWMNSIITDANQINVVWHQRLNDDIWIGVNEYGRRIKCCADQRMPHSPMINQLITNTRIWLDLRSSWLEYRQVFFLEILISLQVFHFWTGRSHPRFDGMENDSSDTRRELGDAGRFPVASVRLPGPVPSFARVTSARLSLHIQVALVEHLQNSSLQTSGHQISLDLMSFTSQI